MKKILTTSLLTSSLLLAANIDNGTSSTDFVSNSDNNTITAGYGENVITGNTNTVVDGGGNYIYGSNNTVEGTNNTVLGSNNTVDNTASSSGNFYPNFITANTVVGYNATATGQGSVAIGAGSEATEDFTVSVGTAGNERKITNVAAPTNDTDATNKSYVDTADTNTLNSAKSYTDTATSNAVTTANNYTDTRFSTLSSSLVTESSVDTKDQAVLNQSKTYTDQKINSLEETLTKDIKTATATAIALAVSPILSNGQKQALGIGFGNYEGESAVAINYIAEINNNTYFQIGSSLNASHRGFKAGLSIGF